MSKLVEMTPQGGPTAGRSVGPGHELSDVKTRGIVLFVIALVTLAVVVHFVLGAFMSSFKKDERAKQALRPPTFRDERGQFPAPRTQVTPRQDLKDFRRSEDVEMNNYSWSESESEVARIPIQRAMDILAQRGLPKSKAIAPRGSRTRDQP